MTDQIIFGLTSLAAVAVVAFATLRGWQGWLTLKEHELERAGPPPRERDAGSAIGAARIELSDLKERIKKLEAIASGVDI